MTEEANGKPTAPEEPNQAGQTDLPPTAESESAAPATPATEVAAEPEPAVPAAEPEPAVVPEPAATPEPPAAPAVPDVAEGMPVPPPVPQPPAPQYETAPQPSVPQAPSGAAPQLPQQPYGAPQPQQPYGTMPQPGMGNPYAPMGYAPQQPVPGTPGSGKALGALICGICAILFSGTVIIGVVLGIIALVLASQYIKSFGKEGKATGGKVCGIIGIVLSVLALVFWISFGALAVVAINDYADYRSSLPNVVEPADPADPDATDPDVPLDSTDQDTVDALMATTMALKLSDNEQLVAYVAEEADNAFYESADQRLADVGLDSKEFALWLMEGMQVDIDASDVFAVSDGTGSAFATVTCRSMGEVLSQVYDSMVEFSDAGGTLSSDEEYVAKVTEFMQAAMEKSPTAESYIALELEKKGGTWTVTEDSLEDAAEQMFELY